MSVHEAWSLVCRLFSGGTPVLRGALSPAEVRATALLGAALKPTVTNRTFALCPYCQLRNGQIFADDQGGLFCHCPDCGRIALTPDDRAAVVLDENWLRSRLRIAMDIESRDGVTELADGVWRLGNARREPVLLSRSLARLWAEPAIFDRVRVAREGIRVIAPQSSATRGAPFPSGIEWLPLEERFTLYGGRISYIPGPTALTAEEPTCADPSSPVNGPFSADFGWVTLPGWSHGAIRCTDGQAAVFKSLWSFKAVEVEGERVMKRAGLASGKPNDLFKVKQRYKGNPDYEGPIFAYRALVKSNRREGTYWMPCAGGAAGSA
jgi:hypothetical protein